MSASISSVTFTFAPIRPAKCVITSSAMRPASRPVRVASSETLPWNRVGRRVGRRRYRPGSGRRHGRSVSVVRSRRHDGCAFRVELPPRDFRLDDHTRGIHVRERNGLPAAQSDVAAGLLVEAVGAAEAVVGPGQQPHAVGDGLQQHVRILKARQVKVAGEVLDDLTDRYVVSAPQRHPVELHPQAGAGKARRQQIVALQSARGPLGQGALPGQPCRLPSDRIGRLRLDRDQ